MSMPSATPVEVALVAVAAPTPTSGAMISASCETLLLSTVPTSMVTSRFFRTVLLRGKARSEPTPRLVRGALSSISSTLRLRIDATSAASAWIRWLTRVRWIPAKLRAGTSFEVLVFSVTSCSFFIFLNIESVFSSYGRIGAPAAGANEYLGLATRVSVLSAPSFASPTSQTRNPLSFLPIGLRPSRLARPIRAGLPVGPLGISDMNTTDSGRNSVRRLPSLNANDRSSSRLVMRPAFMTTATPTTS
mmetsp:Transcript_48884/g.137916  ORF Transcript_48884/g.137916 Transcript_48884/m.137916 type:complete len:247 (+) Transcript_48884:6799-7539(+)